MGLNQLSFVTAAVLTVTIVVSTSAFPYPQQQSGGRYSLDEIYQAYSPGQYAIDGGQQQQFVRVAGPARLVRNGGGSVLRAIPASQLKRVRINPNVQQHTQFIQPQETYAIDSPIYTQAVPSLRSSTTEQQEPTYYVQTVQRNPIPLHTTPRIVPKSVVKVARPRLQQQLQILRANENNNAQSDTEEDDEYPPDLNPQYNFAFDVKDDDLTNYQNRQEERDGNTVKGSYSVVDPDGYVRTVTYTADSKNGFQAKVTREPTDVKIKFPVPTEAPEEQPQHFARPHSKSSVPSLRTQQFAQYPSTISQYSHQAPATTYSQQSQLASGAYYAGGEPLIVRRIPASALHGDGRSSSPRLVKILRQ